MRSMPHLVAAILLGSMAYALFETSLGVCGVAWSEAGLTWLQLPEEDPDATRARLTARATTAEELAGDAIPGWVRDAIARLRQHLGGRPQDLERIPLDLGRASPFNARVLRAAQRIAPGRTVTYGELAEMAGEPRTVARAVGRAMAQNPLPVVVPCHRVVASGGGGGFSAYGGLVTKERLLTLEGGSLAGGQQSLEGLFAGSAKLLPYDGAAAVTHLTEADRVLGRLIAKVGPLRLQLEASEGTFAALAEAIVYQQLHARAAGTIFGRVKALFPPGRFEPRRLLALDDAQLRGAGLSASKLASLQDLSRRSEAGEIPSLAELATMDDDAIVERLTVVRGIGRWTVEMLLIFRLGRPDVLPVADYGIRKGFGLVFPARGTGARTGAKGGKGKEVVLPPPATLLARGERWRPFRSVASWYLWRSLDAASWAPAAADPGTSPEAQATTRRTRLTRVRA